MAGGADVVLRACASIAMALLSTDRYAGQIILPCCPRFRPQRQHDLLPFSAVRPDPVCTVEHIHNIMGNLMGNGCCYIVIKILGKYVGVIANYTVSIVHPVHASCTALKVKLNRDQGEIPGIDLAGVLNNLTRSGAYLFFTARAYRFDDPVCFRTCHWRN